MLDPDAINQYFATIATDNSYCIQDVVSYRVPVDQKHTDLCPLWDYQTELLLRALRTSSGFDDLPCWVVIYLFYFIIFIVQCTHTK